MARGPTLDTTLRHWPWVVVRFRCDFCRRGRAVRLATLADTFGEHTTVARLLDIWVRKCKRHPDVSGVRPQKYGWHCTGYICDLGNRTPPDLPANMRANQALRVVGGRDAAE